MSPEVPQRRSPLTQRSFWQLGRTRRMISASKNLRIELKINTGVAMAYQLHLEGSTRLCTCHHPAAGRRPRSQDQPAQVTCPLPISAFHRRHMRNGAGTLLSGESCELERTSQLPNSRTCDTRPAHGSPSAHDCCRRIWCRTSIDSRMAEEEACQEPVNVR